MIELAPDTTLGPYRLLRKLGAGAFAEVWLAREEGALGFERKVALKVLKKGANEGDTHFANLVNEARVCGHLQHPHIVNVQGVSRAEDLWFIAMEFVDGATLEDLMQQVHASRLVLPRSIILDIGIQIAEALAYAHAARGSDGKPLGIVHRDLKPANIMIARVGGVKVADFGIAKATTNIDSTATGNLKGTPAYVAPEVWRGGRDFRPCVDLFALGAILWEMVTQRRLLDGDSIAAMAGQAVLGDPDQEVLSMRDTFPELAPIVRRLLERDPAARTQSGGELAVELRRLRRGVEAPGDLDLFLELLELARTDRAARAPSSRVTDLPATDEPGWSQVIRVVTGGHATLPSNRALQLPDTAPVLSVPAAASSGARPQASPAVSGGASPGVPVPAPPPRVPAPVHAPFPNTGAALPPDLEPVGPTREARVDAQGTQSMQLGPRSRGKRLPLGLIAGVAGLVLFVAAAVIVTELRSDAPPPPAPEATPDPFAQLVDGGDLVLPDPTPPPLRKPEPQTASSTAPPPAAAVSSPEPAPPPRAAAPPEPTPIAPEPTPSPEPAATPAPTPASATASPAAGCVALMSVPVGAYITIDGAPSGLRGRTGPTSLRSFPPGPITVGMGNVAGVVDASARVDVRAGRATAVRCLVNEKRCSVQPLPGTACPGT